MISGRGLGAEKLDAFPPLAEHQPLATVSLLQEAARY
jgi:hypothetical protein